ncbi:MAG: hypothetical protein HPY59_01640 [Anaerolineae bacterium]|nr:hypothetical protein [Anaerolineae bacterium]
MAIKKLTFEEAWDTSTIFYVDDDLENEIDQKVRSLLETAEDTRITDGDPIDEGLVKEFLLQRELGLDVILLEIELSEEKFMRIISLLRKLGRVKGGFDTEWSIQKIKTKLRQDPDFLDRVVNLLLNGKRDAELSQYIPRYYLETLNYSEIRSSSFAARYVRYKKSLIGTYSGRKGYKVEEQIRNILEDFRHRYGVPFAKGRSLYIETDIDFAVPTLEDPWVIIMSSFQETTSSGQSTKARDMLNAYEKVQRANSRYNENRVFINFVDGGGWLARKRDYQRLVNQCHYFVNLRTLNQLEEILLQTVPKRYFAPADKQ